MSWSALLLLSLALCALVNAYPSYNDQLPNGNHVIHPCQPNSTWPGVGYLKVMGSGPRNVFGKDFSDAGNRWTRELCQKDSDGDGRTNGEELGDPSCIWVPGSTPEITTGITHPGVCEPLSSATCRSQAVPQDQSATFRTQQEWMEDVCQEELGSDCHGLENTQDVREQILRIPQTKVPAKQTTYLCATFQFDDVNADYHVIASDPILNNTNVIHHMLLYGCSDDAEVHGPREINCDLSKCPHLLVGWTLGGPGTCFHDGAGIRMGKNGFKKMMMQYHWNNAEEVDHYTDSSGMKLYYTPNLRPNDMAMLMVGQLWLQIPPRSVDAVFTSDCSSACTSNLMNGDIYVTQAFNHMHLTGIAQSVELLRDGKHVAYITNENDYHYGGTPKFFHFPQPVVVKPGDIIRTTCHFATPNHNTTVFYGDGTLQEMCYSFLTFFPLQNMPRHECTTWKSLTRFGCDPDSLMGCDVEAFQNDTAFAMSQLFTNIMGVCDPFGPCISECKAAIQQARRTEPCMMHSDTWDQLKWETLRNNDYGKKFLAALESCWSEIAVDAAMAASNAGSEKNLVNEVNESTGASHVTRPLTMATVVMMMLSFLLTSWWH